MEPAIVAGAHRLCRSGDFVDRHFAGDPAQVAALVRSVVHAAEWAGQPGNLPELAGLLAEPRYVGAPEAVLLRALQGKLRLARGHEPVSRPGFFRPDAGATVPELAHAHRFHECMLRWQQIQDSRDLESLALASFRPDLRSAAMASVTKHERQG